MFRFLTIILMISVFNFANAQKSSKILFKSLKPQTETLIVQNETNFNFDVIETKGSKIFIEITVSINNNPHILEALIKAGRYNNLVEIKEENYNSILILKNELSFLTVRGKTLTEWITIKIFVPDDYYVEIKDMLLGFKN